jgi:histidinol-phosphate/aromatic aminotransferase/cobyric acid decarboxylase-like protein
VFLTAILARHGLSTLPSEASFVASPVPNAIALTEQLALRGVLVRAVPDPPRQLVRIAVGDDADLALLDAALGGLSPP